MKTMLVVLMMAGMMLGAHALKCNQCVDIAYDSNNDALKDIIKNSLGESNMASCSASSNTDCAQGLDECVANVLSYTMKVGDVSVAVGQVVKMCSASSVDTSTMCDPVKSAMGNNPVFKNVKCKTETCKTDGCNTQTAKAAAAGLSFSVLLFASVVIAMFY